MVDNAEKVRENRLRRVAQRRGLTLTRSRRRDVRAFDYGRYWLTDDLGQVVRQGTVDQIEEFLDQQ